jgi:hypothetical protein
MSHLVEAFGWATPDPAGWRIRIGERGMRGFEAGEFTHQGVEVRVGDLGRAVDVIALFVVTDEVTKLRYARRRLARRAGGSRLAA